MIYYDLIMIYKIMTLLRGYIDYPPTSAHVGIHGKVVCSSSIQSNGKKTFLPLVRPIDAYVITINKAWLASVVALRFPVCIFMVLWVHGHGQKAV